MGKFIISDKEIPWCVLLGRDEVSVKNMIIARSKFLLPLSREQGLGKRIEDGYILTQGNKIIETGKYTPEKGKQLLDEHGNELIIIGSSDSRGEDRIPMINGILLPGFIKSHGHDHESPIIGVAKDVPLTTWLDDAVNLFTGFTNEKIDELKEIFGCSPYLISYMKARLDDIGYGITSALTHHCNFNKYYVDDIVESSLKAGTKLIVAIGSQDRNYDSRILDGTEEAVDRVDKYYQKYKDEPLIRIIPGPDQLFSNGPEILKALKQWSRENGTLIHVHSSEEPATTKWFIETYGMTPVEYADSIGFLDENALLAHQVNTSEHDMEILKRTKTMIVHNPLANTILGSGMPPVMEMLGNGIPVVISTDGSGSADNQNIINAARLASQYQKAYHRDAKVMTAQQVLEMITVIPAGVLRLNAGSLDPGKDADFIIVDLSVPNMTPTRLKTVVENLIWAANGSEIKHVVANGKILVENYNFKTLDRHQILKDVQKLADMFGEFEKTAERRKETGFHAE